MLKELETFTDEKFDEIRHGVIASLKEPNKTLGDQFAEDWTEVFNHTRRWKRRDWIVEQLNKLNKQDILAFFRKVFFEEKKCIELHQYSQTTLEDSIKQREEREKKEGNIKVHTCIESLKRSCDLLVDHYSIM